MLGRFFGFRPKTPDPAMARSPRVHIVTRLSPGALDCRFSFCLALLHSFLLTHSFDFFPPHANFCPHRPRLSPADSRLSLTSVPPLARSSFNAPLAASPHPFARSHSHSRPLTLDAARHSRRLSPDPRPARQRPPYGSRRLSFCVPAASHPSIPTEVRLLTDKSELPPIFRRNRTVFHGEFPG